MIAIYCTFIYIPYIHHARWQPVKQSARSRRSYGKIGDCEQSTTVTTYRFQPNGYQVTHKYRRATAGTRERDHLSVILLVVSLKYRQRFFNSRERSAPNVTKTWNGKRETSHGKREIEKWEHNRELEIKELIGLGFKLRFVPTFHFPVLLL